MSSNTALPSSTPQSQANCLPSLQRHLAAGEISGDAAAIVSASWKESTWRSYSSLYRQWSEYCLSVGHDCSEPSVKILLDFLASMYHRGCSYSYINTARSAISMFVSNTTPRIGEHHLVIQFMKGVRNLRPSAPKYPIMWDVSALVKFLSQWNLHAMSSLKDITIKLATVLALLSVQRVHTLSLIDFKSIQFLSSATYLHVYADLKVARSRPSFVITLPALSETDPLQSASLLQWYLAMTVKFRLSEISTALFLSYVPPHRPVSTDTLARWIKDSLSRAGIDISVFGAHSVRSASASAARANGAALDSILSAGDWSGVRTYNKHYQRRTSLLSAPTVANSILHSLR